MSSKIMFLWGFVVLLICSFLLIMGNIGKDYNLFLLEKEIKHSSRDYLKDKNRYPSVNNTEVVFIDELVDNEYIKENEDYNKYCIKSIEVNNKIFIDKVEVIKECKSEMKEDK